TLLNNNIFTIKELSDNQNNRWVELTLNTQSGDTYFNRNLKKGQHIQLFITDITNDNNQYISKNHGKKFKIRNVFIRTLVLDYFDIDDKVYEESSVINN